MLIVPNKDLLYFDAIIKDFKINYFEYLCSLKIMLKELN